MFTHGMNKLTACMSGRISDLLNVYSELQDPNVLDQLGYRFQFQNPSERSTQKYTSYVCVSEKGAVACTCSCPSAGTFASDGMEDVARAGELRQVRARPSGRGAF